MLNFILICTLIGAVGVFLGKLWDKTEPLLAWVLSFFVSGIFIGLLLFGIMGFGWLVGWWNDIYIFSFHPFWVGLVLMTVREVALTLYCKLR